MSTLIEERSTITAKGQTTVPKAVRQALGVTYGDEIVFSVDDQGVSLRRADAEDSDPVLESFLGFLAQDIKDNPQNVSSFPAALARRMAELTEGVEIDFEEEIVGPVAL